MLEGDIVIVGGGPAGLTTALAAARARPALLRRIVVLEAATYPREKPCAGALGGRGDRLLDELDAAPRVPSVAIDGISLRVRDGETSARVGGIGRVVRRFEFDAALAEIAKARGVRVVEGARVTAIEPSGGRARVATTQGDLDASIVIGADGVGSVVRKSLGLEPGALRAQVLEVDTEPVAGDRDRAMLHFDASDRRFRGYTWDFPTLVDGRPLVCRGIYHLKGDEAQIDIKALFAERLTTMGLDLASYKNKRFAERGYEPPSVIADETRMLVGEAAGIDPVTGEGIAQAIEFGVLAGRFLADEVMRGAPLERWTKRVRSSRLGRDLQVRNWGAEIFYGPKRPVTERFLLGCYNAMHIGCEHFGALPVERFRLADLAARLTATVVRERLFPTGA